MDFELLARFEGGAADLQRLPAQQGAQSLYGISRSIDLMNNYFATGTIRKRAPFSNLIQVYLEPPRPGSFESVLSFVLNHQEEIWAFGKAVGADEFVLLMRDYMRTLYCRVTGREGEPGTKLLQDLDKERPGDLDALTDAIEPAVKATHQPIGAGAQTVNIYQGDVNIVNFNPATKEYVSGSELNPNRERQDVSVAALSVNQRTGRVFFHDLGKTVPFTVSAEAQAQTMAQLADSLNRYASELPSDVSILFSRVQAFDGRTKRIIIFSAGPADDDE